MYKRMTLTPVERWRNGFPGKLFVYVNAKFEARVNVIFCDKICFFVFAILFKGKQHPRPPTMIKWKLL